MTADPDETEQQLMAEARAESHPDNVRPEDSEPVTPCPDCNGEGSVWVMSYPTLDESEFPCSTCDQTGIAR